MRWQRGTSDADIEEGLSAAEGRAPGLPSTSSGQGRPGLHRERGARGLQIPGGDTSSRTRR
jgi:hypothetical protein